MPVPVVAAVQTSIAAAVGAAAVPSTPAASAVEEAVVAALPFTPVAVAVVAVVPRVAEAVLRVVAAVLRVVAVAAAVGGNRRGPRRWRMLDVKLVRAFAEMVQGSSRPGKEAACR